MSLLTVNFHEHVGISYKTSHTANAANSAIADSLQVAYVQVKVRLSRSVESEVMLAILKAWK